MTEKEAAVGPERILVLAPIGRDAALLCQVLGQAGLSGVAYDDLGELVRAIQEGAGVVLITDETFDSPDWGSVLNVLATQPALSDLPIVLLLDGNRSLRQARSIDALRSTGSLTVLARPVRGVSLITAVQAALRARRRQYEIRDLIMSEQAARQEADAASQWKDVFLATVSHDLRTPLTAILLRTRLLRHELDETRRALDDTKLRRAIDAIERSAEAQSRLVEDLLDVSRIVSGNFLLEMKDAELGPLVIAAIEIIRPSAEAKGIHVEASVEPDTGVLRIDPHRLQQVVWNLLSNSVKFTPSGGSVSVRLWREQGHVSISVADTGQGISPAFLPYVFDRFRQADPLDAYRHGGLGLGLAISRHIVESLGGTIRAESAGEGRGSVFTITLPGGSGEPSA